LRGKTVERLRLVEAAHLDGVPAGCAPAIERKPPIGLARNGHYAAIELGRIRAIDLDLGLARRLALLERGIVEKRELHRALELEHALAGEEQYARVGIDALDR